MSPRISFRLLAAAAFCLLAIGLALLFAPFPRSAKAATAPSKPRSKVSVLESGEAPAAENPLKIRSGGDGDSELLISLDEVCLRGADGAETIAKLDPPAKPGTLAARLAEFSPQSEALPTAYPEGEERSEKNRRIVTRKLRVQLPDDIASRIARANGLEIAERPDYAPGWIIMSAADPLAAVAAVDGLRAAPEVSSADVLLAKRRFSRSLPNDPLIGNQWHLKKTSFSSVGTDLNIEDAWKYGLSGGVKGIGIRIGIIDNGVETGHPDFVGNIDLANGWDWNGNDSNPNPGSTDNHGTACAGVAAARGNNGLGVSGTAPEAQLVGLRLTAAAADDSQEAAAMNWKSDIIQIKSNSWGPDDDGVTLEAPGSLTKSAFVTATTSGRGGKGSIIVWAGGNGKEEGDNSNYDGYANSPYTIAVGAVDSKGRSSYYSEPGANLLVCAPSNGADTALAITTVDRSGSPGYNSTDYYNNFGGTSSAAPAVAGVVALMLEKNPNLGWRDVQEILIRSATKFLPTDSAWKTNGAGFSFNPQFGAGLVNATAAVNLAASWTNLAAQTSVTVTQNGSSAIPENNAAGVSRTFDFSASPLRVEQVTVTLSATHTARGNLAITLTSPGGMVSQLSEVHGDTGNNYSAWTFGSVEHWGELAAGNWTVKVADLSGTGNTSGGTLGNVSVTLLGAPAKYADWISNFAVADASTTADPDGDGLPNLVEYALGSNPKTAGNPIAFGSSAGEISLTYPQSKLPADVALAAEWSTTLAPGSWQTAGIGTSLVAETSSLKTWKATLAIDPAAPKKFLRLKATTVP